MSRDTTVRCCLKKALDPGPCGKAVDVQQVLDIIDEAVVHVSRIAARGSQVALLVVLRTLERNDGRLPDDFFGTSIDTFFDQCFKVGLYGKEDTCARKPKRKPTMSDVHTKENEKGKETLNKYVLQTYQDAEVASSLANQTVRRKHGDSNLLVYASQTYETNFLNFYDCDLEKRIHTYVKAVWRWKFPPDKNDKKPPKGTRYRCCRLAAEPWNTRLAVPDDLPSDVLSKVLACRTKYADIIREEGEQRKSISRDAEEVTKELRDSEKTADDKKEAEKSRKALKKRRRDLKHRGILWRMELVYWMLKEIDALGCEYSKGFSMAPLTTLQRKHIRIDSNVFSSYLVPRLREIGYYGKDAILVGMESEHLAAFFRASGLRSPKRGWKQGASFQTDGYALCTRFVKGKEPGSGRRTARDPEETPAPRDKKRNKKNAGGESDAAEKPPGTADVGMDMGLVNPFCAAWKKTDGSTSHKILSRRSYYLESGIRRHREITSRREKKLEKVREAQSATCSRTANWSRVLKYVATVDANSEAIWEQYADRRLSRSRMVSEMGKVSVLDRWCRELRGELARDGVRDVPVMAVGYPSFNSSMPGCPAAPTTTAFKALGRHFKTLAVDEYMTSQVDPSDPSRLLKKPKITEEVNGRMVTREVRGIRLCPESPLEPRAPPRVYDREPERWEGYRRLLRDVVGALNMLVVASKKNEERPGLLKRTPRIYEASVVA